MAKKTFKVAADIKPGKGFPTVPGGTYRFKVTAKTDIKNKNGKDTLLVHAKITKGPHAGKTVLEGIQLTKNVEWKLAQFLTAIGMTLKSIRGKSLSLDKLIGKEFKAVVREETYQGRKQNKIATFLTVGGVSADNGADDGDGEEELDEDVEEGEEGEEEEGEEEAEEEDEDAEEGEEEEESEEEESDEDEADEDEGGEEEEEGEESEEEESEEESEDEDEEDAAAARKARRLKRKKAAAAAATKSKAKPSAKKAVAKKKK